MYDNVCVLLLGEFSHEAESIIKQSIALYLLALFLRHTHTHIHTARASSISPLLPLSRSNSAYLERRLHGGDRGGEKRKGKKGKVWVS